MVVCCLLPFNDVLGENLLMMDCSQIGFIVRCHMRTIVSLTHSHDSPRLDETNLSRLKKISNKEKKKRKSETKS